jgi:hypothetical protein
MTFASLRRPEGSASSPLCFVNAGTIRPNEIFGNSPALAERRWRISGLIYRQSEDAPIYNLNQYHRLSAHIVIDEIAIAKEKLINVPIKTYSAIFCSLASSKRRMDFAATKNPMPAGCPM